MKQSENLQGSVKLPKKLKQISAYSKNPNKQTFSSVDDKLFSLLPKQQKQLKLDATRRLLILLNP